jgi:membrane-bound ClpP family serine protease
MLKVLLILIIAYILYELFEHLVLPLYWVISKKQKRSPTGESGMVGLIAEVKEWEGTKGKVFVHGGLWNAESQVSFNPGDEVKVLSIKRLVLTVGTLDT